MGICVGTHCYEGRPYTHIIEGVTDMVRILLEASYTSIKAVAAGEEKIKYKARTDANNFSHLSEEVIAYDKAMGNMIECASTEEAERVAEVCNTLGVSLVTALCIVRQPKTSKPLYFVQVDNNIEGNQTW